jgi:hypothetical protein
MCPVVAATRRQGGWDRRLKEKMKDPIISFSLLVGVKISQ